MHKAITAGPDWQVKFNEYKQNIYGCLWELTLHID